MWKIGGIKIERTRARTFCFCGRTGKSVKNGIFLLFGPLLGNKESYLDLPYGLLAEQKINHVVKTYFRVSVYPLGSGSVGAETETREKIWAQRRKNHRSLAWDILPLCPGIHLLCGEHCPFIHLRSTTWTRATWTGSRSMSTTLQRSSAQPWPTHPPWPPRPTPATQVDLKTLFHFTSTNHMFSLF